MSDDVTIRPVESGDMPDVATIYVDAAREAVDREPDHFWTPTADDAARMLIETPAATEAVMLVACRDEHVQGFVEVALRPRARPGSMLGTRAIGYVRELGVAQQARGAGVGAMLLAAAEGWARSRGVRP